MTDDSTTNPDDELETLSLNERPAAPSPTASDASAAPGHEPTVRQLLEDPKGHSDALDADTLAELQRWFGLPSAMDLPPPEPEPEQLTRREEALAAVDPAFLSYLHRIANRVPLMMEEPSLELRAKETLATTPERFTAAANLGEPREVEISYLLTDDLKEVVPQALLRDLHRVEEYFGLYYELTKVSEGIPNVRRDIQAAITRGEEERKQMMIRQERDRALSDRQMIHAFPWATAAKPVPASALPDEEG
jgi:hypothetical protein